MLFIGCDNANAKPLDSNTNTVQTPNIGSGKDNTNPNNNTDPDDDNTNPVVEQPKKTKEEKPEKAFKPFKIAVTSRIEEQSTLISDSVKINYINIDKQNQLLVGTNNDKYYCEFFLVK